MITFDNIVEGFAEVEKRDLRVDRVVIPLHAFLELQPQQCPGVPYPLFDANPLKVNQYLGKRNTASRPVYAGSLWGADLYIGGDRVLLGPEQNFSHACSVIEVDNEGVKATFDVPSVHNVRVIGSHTWTRKGLTVIVKTHCKPVWPIGYEEGIALEALREMITEEEYRSYLRTGFLRVRGASGLTYQIPRRGHFIQVYDRGRKVESICAYIPDSDVPLTDKVVAFKAIIETDEDDLRARGNVYNYRNEAAAAA